MAYILHKSNAARYTLKDKNPSIRHNADYVVSGDVFCVTSFLKLYNISAKKSTASQKNLENNIFFRQTKAGRKNPSLDFPFSRHFFAPRALSSPQIDFQRPFRFFRATD